MHEENLTAEDFREKILDEMCELGRMYFDDGNVEQALYWMNLAASLGSNRANYELGKMYYYGNSVPEDEPKAAEYFEKAGGFDCNLDVIFGFGDMYRYGRGVEKNINKAIFWYEQEAFWGNRDAKYALAEIYRNGEGGIQPDGEKAVKYFIELAFGSGDYFFVTDTKIYEDGHTVPMTYSERDYFFSFDTGNGDDEARFALGCMYLYGQAVKPNVYKAAWWFAKIDEIDRFDWNAIFDLAEKYRTGDDIEKDIHVAIAWYEKIIEFAPTNYDRALFALAEIYFYGDGVERDVEKAIDLYQQAADTGNLKAAHRLSEIYFDGEVVKKNLSEARYYLNKTIKGLLNQIER